MNKRILCAAAAAVLSPAVWTAGIDIYGAVDLFAAVNNDSGDVTSVLQSGAGLGVRYDYPRSKRTFVYGGISAVFNESRAQRSIEAGPDSSPHIATAEPGDDAQILFFAMHHAF